LETRRFDIPGPLLLIPRRFADARGHFCETWNSLAFAAACGTADFVQDNESLSRPAGTLRGLHAQRPPHAQAKLVRVVQGAVRDVAVDIRRGSPHFGRAVVADLNVENGAQLFIPEGFLHGFLTRTPDTLVQYKCTAFYAPGAEIAVRWDDPALAIDWGLPADAVPVLSDKDAAAGSLAALVAAGTGFDWRGTE
jgi:dTDP-4-dehydrorhamnose 3,5-epimerase